MKTPWAARFRFQLRLSTCVVLMVVAGVLMFLHGRAPILEVTSVYQSSFENLRLKGGETYPATLQKYSARIGYGWPCAAYQYDADATEWRRPAVEGWTIRADAQSVPHVYDEAGRECTNDMSELMVGLTPIAAQPTGTGSVSLGPAVLDAVCSLLILFAVAWIAEACFRGMHPQAPPQGSRDPGHADVARKSRGKPSRPRRRERQPEAG